MMYMCVVLSIIMSYNNINNECILIINFNNSMTLYTSS